MLLHYLVKFVGGTFLVRFFCATLYIVQPFSGSVPLFGGKDWNARPRGEVVDVSSVESDRRRRPGGSAGRMESALRTPF